MAGSSRYEERWKEKNGYHSGAMMASQGRGFRIIKPEMCYFCFDVLYCHLYNLQPPQVPSFCNENYPLFVTWKIGKDQKLRGRRTTFRNLSKSK